MTRDALLRALAHQLSEADVGHPLRVGIDGVCGVGKTRFADELAGHLQQRGHPVIRLDSDGFHHVRVIRHRQQHDLARGYYEDAYDFAALRDLVLLPLGPKHKPGDRKYACRVHDLVSDEVVREWRRAPEDAVLVFDATFLQRDGLREHWDEVIYLDASSDAAQHRGVNRDAAALGGQSAAIEAYRRRYMAACEIYLREQSPRERASILIDHEDPALPRLVGRSADMMER